MQLQPSQRRRYLLTALLFMVVLAVLGAMVDWGQVWGLVRHANLAALLTATGLLVAGYVGLAWRWKVLLRGRAPMLPAFHASNIGTMVNTLLPLRPGDPLRIFLLRGHGGLSGMQVASSLVVERWYEGVMRVAALVAAIQLGSGPVVSHRTLAWVLAGLAASWTFMLWAAWQEEWLLETLPPLLSRLPRLREEQVYRAVVHLLEGFASLSSPWRMAEGLLSSMLVWTCFWGFHYLALEALAPELPLNVALGISLGSLALAPPSASTIPGVYQVSVTVPLALLGYDRHLLTSYSLVMNLIEMVFVNGLGLLGAAAMGLNAKELLGKH